MREGFRTLMFAGAPKTRQNQKCWLIFTDND
jgi:hypothetical protein